jgi:hydrogenase-4 component F
VTALDAVLLIPALGVLVLAFVTNYRVGALLNVLASGATFAAGVSLLFAERWRSDLLIVDDFNIYLVTLTTFVAFTTSIFSATYIGHELEIGRLTPTFLRFYHALYQAMIGAMNLALVANNVGLLWVGLEVATLSTVMMVGIYRTPEAVEAAWKYFILGSVGIALAFFGTILIYIVAQDVIGEGVPAMAWDKLVENAPRLDPKLLSLAFVFLLVGYGTKVGLAPFHAWLPDAHAEGPTPISAVLSGLLLNVALYALLRFKIVLSANPATLNVGLIMTALGLISLVFAAFMLYRRRDIKRLFAYSSIEHMGIITFAFGIGGPLANFAGLLHMTMHSLTKSAIFFAVGHVAQVKGTQRIADIRGLSSTHPALAVGLGLAVIAIAGAPPFGVFMSEFLLVSSSFARQPLLAVVLVFGLLVAFGALILRLQQVLFGEPSGPTGKAKASYVPLFVHLAIVLAAGLWLPEPVVRWFRAVAAQLG